MRCALEEMKCPECDGVGVVEGEFTIGGIDANGPWVAHIPEVYTCEMCSGWAEVEDDE